MGAVTEMEVLRKTGFYDTVLEKEWSTTNYIGQPRKVINKLNSPTHSDKECAFL